MAVVQYVCSWQGCRTLLHHRGYCDKHKPMAEQQEQARQQKRKDAFKKACRTNYAMYRTKEWSALRKKVLQQHPYCTACGSCVDLHVDHIRPPRGNEAFFFDVHNLQVLCEVCHRQKTAAEIAARKQQKSGKSKEDARIWLNRYVSHI